ncbi:MAG TPA: hypothetical protein VGY49_06430 [Burkholderiaceae bacterium]|jgi:hypothetical protein|nr:hypothetical protein [Burkholderiaceae bacterium]
MKRHRGDRKVHLELLRARAAADRLELSLAIQDLSGRLDPLRRAADAIGSVANALGGRGRTLGWLAAAAAALDRARWVRWAVAGAAAVLRAGGPRTRGFALGALAAGLIGVMGRRRRARRSAVPTSEPPAGGGGETD